MGKEEDTLLLGDGIAQRRPNSIREYPRARWLLAAIDHLDELPATNPAGSTHDLCPGAQDLSAGDPPDVQQAETFDPCAGFENLASMHRGCLAVFHASPPLLDNHRQTELGYRPERHSVRSDQDRAGVSGRVLPDAGQVAVGQVRAGGHDPLTESLGEAGRNRMSLNGSRRHHHR
jgi:hypothetical protein